MDSASFQDRCHPSHQTPAPPPQPHQATSRPPYWSFPASHRLPRRFPQSKIQPPSPVSLSKDFNVQPSSQLPQEVFSDPLARSFPPWIAEGAIYLKVPPHLLKVPPRQPCDVCDDAILVMSPNFLPGWILSPYLESMRLGVP